MKKRIQFMLLLAVLLLSACSSASVEESGGEETKEKITQDVQPTDQSKKESTEQENDEEENKFIFRYNSNNSSLEIELDKRLKDSLVINVADFYYRDKTLLRQDIFLGTITSMPLVEWENQNYWDRDYSFVYYDHNNQIIYLFKPDYGEPYTDYVNELNTNDNVPAEYENYVYTYESLINSLLNYGFVSSDLIMKQSIPKQLDSNQEIGIDISRSMYQDLQNWYSTLNSSIKNEMSIEEKYKVISNTQLEVEQKYPELRQIPFPTLELSVNIVNCIDLLKGWTEIPYRADEANHLYIDNRIKMLRQNLEVVDKQLKEFE
ncbi:hypothetical protein [Caldifermentibacillus hisashii]|uniref:hypothetical protein n=1 Tax=Caldifermentibacillus hisashii TaxID=996558 RepID=UPI0031017C1A